MSIFMARYWIAGYPKLRITNLEFKIIDLCHRFFQANQHKFINGLGTAVNFQFDYCLFRGFPFSQNMLHLPAFGKIISNAKPEPGVLDSTQEFLNAF